MVADICGIIPEPVQTARRIIQLDLALPLKVMTMMVMMVMMVMMMKMVI